MIKLRKFHQVRQLGVAVVQLTSGHAMAKVFDSEVGVRIYYMDVFKAVHRIGMLISMAGLMPGTSFYRKAGTA
jgi:hypothetical protein